MAGVVQDMTKGKEAPLLIKFTVPLLIGNLFQQCYSIIDSIIVGRVEGAAVFLNCGKLFKYSFGCTFCGRIRLGC